MGGHKRGPVVDRFMEKVEMIPEAGCWIWMSRLTRGGYGNFLRDRRRVSSHRLSWELFRGEIPNGYEIDHLCRTRSCVNPDHLEPVSPKENRIRGMGFGGRNARKDRCPRGHAYSHTVWHPFLTGVRPNRKCQTCIDAANKRKRNCL